MQTMNQNERLSDIAEHQASVFIEHAKQHKIHMLVGMFLFDVCAQWLFDELCRETSNPPVDPNIPALEVESPLKDVIIACLEQRPQASSHTAQGRAAQFLHQLQSRYPNPLPHFPDDFHHLLAHLDEQWYTLCEATEGTGIAEAKSDRLRRYIWKSLAIVEGCYRTLKLS